jgi:dimethylargininase
MAPIALTHAPSPQIACALRTHHAPAVIDQRIALCQHQAYCEALRNRGISVRVLDVNLAHPDSVFIEDTAVVLAEIAVLCSMGAPSRQLEPAGIEPELRKYRPVEHLPPGATLEGGDVLVVGRDLLVGLSARTNLAGILALQEIAARHAHRVHPVPVRDCLHLKSACTALPDRTLLINHDWLDLDAIRAWKCIPVAAGEPLAANVLPIGQDVFVAAEHVRTADLIRSRGFTVVPIDHSEFAKADGGITCMSLLV